MSVFVEAYRVDSVRQSTSSPNLWQFLWQLRVDSRQ
jgi:hypothetical protein